MRETSNRKPRHLFRQRVLSLVISANDHVTEYIGLICAVLVLVSACVIVHEVVVRYILKLPTIWQVEFAVYNVIMATFVGAAFGQKHGAHINVDFLIDRFPPKTKRIVVIVYSFIGLIISLVLAVYAWPIWWEAVVQHHDTGTVWGPPLAWPFILLPLGMSLLALHYIADILKKLKLV